jgi:hypothetical protein
MNGRKREKEERRKGEKGTKEKRRKVKKARETEKKSVLMVCGECVIMSVAMGVGE